MGRMKEAIIDAKEMHDHMISFIDQYSLTALVGIISTIATSEEFQKIESEDAKGWFEMVTMELH